jgi:hypothetical protein
MVASRSASASGESSGAFWRKVQTVQLAKGVYTVKPRLAVKVKFFRGHRSGVRRDGVVLSR